MKNILFLFFLLPFQAAFSQYYYKDIVATKQTSDQYRRLKAAAVNKVTLSSFDGNSAETAGFSADQVVDLARGTVLSTTRTAVVGDSYLLATYDAQGRLISTSDSAQNAVTKASYSYDASGNLLHITSSSRSDNITNTEVHEYTYNAQGQPLTMLRVRNGVDTAKIEFIPDEKGLVGEEKTVVSRLPTPSYYYYHDDNARLTDVVRFNPRANRLLPSYMFEYNADGQVKKMTLVPEGSNDYQLWFYQYEPSGLKKMDLCYNKQQQLMGKVQYSYTK